MNGNFNAIIRMVATHFTLEIVTQHFLLKVVTKQFTPEKRTAHFILKRVNVNGKFQREKPQGFPKGSGYISTYIPK